MKMGWVAAKEEMRCKHTDLCMCVDCLGGGEEDKCPGCSKELVEGCCIGCGEVYG